MRPITPPTTWFVSRYLYIANMIWHECFMIFSRVPEYGIAKGAEIVGLGAGTQGEGRTLSDFSWTVVHLVGD